MKTTTVALESFSLLSYFGTVWEIAVNSKFFSRIIQGVHPVQTDSLEVILSDRQEHHVRAKPVSVKMNLMHCLY